MSRIKTHIGLMLMFLTLWSCSGSEQLTQKEGGNKAKKSSLSEAEKISFDRLFFQALTEKSLAEYEKARISFGSALEIDPNNAAAYYELARVEYELDAGSSSLTSAMKAADLNPENIWYQLLVADLSFEYGYFSDAAKEYEKASNLDPSQPDIYYDWANAFLFLEKPDESLKVLNKFEDQFGITEDISLQKHQIYLAKNDIASAEKELKRLQEFYPDEVRYMGMLATFYVNGGRMEEAKVLYDKMMASSPDNGLVHMSLSEFYAITGEDEKSYQSLKTAFASEDVMIDRKIGIMLNYFTQSSSSAQSLNQAHELLDLLIIQHPTDPKARAISGDFLLREGRLEEARSEYRKAIEFDPSRNLLWEQLINIDSQLGDSKAMAEDSDRALELFPTLPAFYLYNGLANIQEKDLSSAILRLNLGKELVIDDPLLSAQFYSALGDAYHASGDSAKSDESYEKSLEKDGNNAFVLNNFSYYLSIRKVNLDRALQMSAKANQIFPNQASFEDTHAWVLFQLERFAEAKTWFEKAIQHGGSGSGVILEHYGDTLFKLGDEEGAVEYWIQAKQAGGTSALIDRKISEKTFYPEND